MKNRISLGYGSGGRLTRDLIKDLFLKNFDNPLLSKLSDSAVFDLHGEKVAVTTDSYVINPIFFPGGDIGKLSVCGTVNDLAVVGAAPLYITLGMIIEEGFPYKDLENITASIKNAAEGIGIKVITGDTKVTEKGKTDGIYINTTGIGVVDTDIKLGMDKIEKGDKIILSGNIGDHGIAVLSKREGFKFESDIESDCAPLNTLIYSAIRAGRIKFMRDPTRGGLAAVLNEITEEGNFEITVKEEEIPVDDRVMGACSILGLDPVYIANEGKVVMVVKPDDAAKILSAVRRDPLGANAAIIGEVTDSKGNSVYLETIYGSLRRIDMPLEDPLPRIC
ncbi:MAG: hydrogenase expression/formation protein HypE [Deltaproteobacteria bacterium GWC2_42_11]|nr:MAG: hydrogenase expression/formation protein HypE [Deltaproteobacteria bacterium GWC2_42_11]HBO83962.1 hydrogenase expression/formation protein HypE [Deltaproteobacteria bacterium]